MSLTATEILVTVVLGAAGSLLAVFLLYAYKPIPSFVKSAFLVDKISIKRITSSGDNLIPSLMELYAGLFPEEDGTNYSVDEFYQIADVKYEEPRHVDVENIILVALNRGEVVGFIFCHLYPKRRKAIISYFGIDKTVLLARKIGPSRQFGAARLLLIRLQGILIQSKCCDYLFFDLEGDDTKHSPDVRHERKARRVLFRNTAKALGYKAQEFQFAYHCPKVALTEFTRESPFSLFCIGITGPIPDIVSKKQMMEFLEFVYIDGYGDFYSITDPRFEAHNAYLKRSIEDYEELLPERIRAI